MYLFTLRFIYIRVLKVNKFMSFDHSELPFSAWHTEFHDTSNIQIWRWWTLLYYGFYNKYFFMPTTSVLHFPMAHRWSDRLSFFMPSSYAFGFFRSVASGPLQKKWLCAQNPHPATARAAAAANPDQAAWWNSHWHTDGQSGLVLTQATPV